MPPGHWITAFQSKLYWLICIYEGLADFLSWAVEKQKVCRTAFYWQNCSLDKELSGRIGDGVVKAKDYLLNIKIIGSLGFVMKCSDWQQGKVFFPWSSLSLAPIMWSHYRGAQLHCEADNDLAALFACLVAAPMEQPFQQANSNLQIARTFWSWYVRPSHWNLGVESREKGGLATTCQQLEKWSLPVSHVPEKSKLWTTWLQIKNGDKSGNPSSL